MCVASVITFNISVLITFHICQEIKSADAKNSSMHICHLPTTTVNNQQNNTYVFW